MICSKCNKDKPSTGKRYCKSCQAEINRVSNRKKLDKIKSLISEQKQKKGGKCVKCNESREHLLDFHHLDPSKKDDNIPTIIRYYGFGEKGKTLVEAEAKKCVLLCSNCHRDFHYEERTNNITIEEYAPFV